MKEHLLLLNNSNCRINNLLLQHQTILYVLSRQLILEPRLGHISAQENSAFNLEMFSGLVSLEGDHKPLSTVPEFITEIPNLHSFRQFELRYDR